MRVVATAIVLLYIGPFSNHSELLRLANDNTKSPWQQLHAGAQESRIAVVLLDDDDVAALGGQWPLSYARWAELLRHLGCAQPKAVFFDILFQHVQEFTRPGVQGQPSFAQVDERVRRGALRDIDCPGVGGVLAPVPVLYAYAGTPSEWLPGVVDDERKLPISWHGVGGDYPLVIEDGARGNRQSVAYFLYRLTCRDSHGSPAPGCLIPPDADDIQQRLVPRWSMKPPKGHDERSDQLCPDTAPHTVIQAALRWLREIFDEPKATPCLPFLTFSGRQLLHDFDVTTASALAGRIVLVGASITGARDLVLTDTHGQLPAVFEHATALENLLAEGSRFDRINVQAMKWISWVLIIAMALAHRTALPWLQRTGITPHSCRYEWAVDLVLLPVTWCIVVVAMRWGLYVPAGMVPQAALTMSVGLLVGELSREGKWYERSKKLLQPELTSRH